MTEINYTLATDADSGSGSFKPSKLHNTEIYLFNRDDDREYFVDKTKESPVGLCETFGITLAERPQIPIAPLDVETTSIPGSSSTYKRENGYGDVEYSLFFNFIDDDAKDLFNRVSNAVQKFEAGTRFRMSDEPNSFRTLSQRPIIEPLNNDLKEWGDFTIRLVFEPFKSIEQVEISLDAEESLTLTPPTPNVLETAQTITHTTNSEEALLKINDEEIYNLDVILADSATVDANRLYAYSTITDEESGYPFEFNITGDRFIFEFRELPFEGFDYGDDSTTPAAIGEFMLGGYIFYVDESLSIDDFIIFNNAEGTEIKKPVHIETAQLPISATVVETGEIAEGVLDVAFFASEGQRYIHSSLTTALTNGAEIKITIETDSQAAESGESRNASVYLQYSTDKTARISVQDVHGEQPEVVYTFETEQGDFGEVTVDNINARMAGRFPTFKNGGNTIESTTAINFRPIWNYL